jgi:hypothetical protein
MTASAQRTSRRASGVATARRGSARRATAAVQVRQAREHAEKRGIACKTHQCAPHLHARRGNGDGAESSGGRLGFCATAAEGGAARVLGEVGVRNRGKAAAFKGGEEARGAWARSLAHASGEAGSGTGRAPVRLRLEVGDDGRGPPVGDRSKAAAGWVAAGPKTLVGLSCRGVRAAAEESLGCTARLC